MPEFYVYMLYGSPIEDQGGGVKARGVAYTWTRTFMCIFYFLSFLFHKIPTLSRGVRAHHLFFFYILYTKKKKKIFGCFLLEMSAYTMGQLQRVVRTRKRSSFFFFFPSPGASILRHNLLVLFSSRS